MSFLAQFLDPEQIAELHERQHRAMSQPRTQYFLIEYLYYDLRQDWWYGPIEDVVRLLQQRPDIDGAEKAFRITTRSDGEEMAKTNQGNLLQ